MDRARTLLPPLLVTLAGLAVYVPPAWCEDARTVAREPRRVVYDVAPTRDGSVELTMDLYLPRGRPVRGAVVLMHGGAFVGGSLDLAENRAYGEALAGRGYVAAAISYRLHGNAPLVGLWAQAYAGRVLELRDPRLKRLMDQHGPELPVAVAAAAEDLLAALAWLREHATELGFDPRNVALFGASAGAITSLTVAYALDEYGGPEVDVACVVSLRGLLLRPVDGENPLARDDPPLLILHGEDDRRIPVTEAERLFRLARDAGLRSELHTAPGYGHELGGEALLALELDGAVTVLDRMVGFLGQAFSRSVGSGDNVRGRLSEPD